VLRRKIVAFVRALIVATERLRRDPQDAQALVAQSAELDIATVMDSWPYLSYPGTLASDLLDALLPVDAWIAKETGRAARTHSELSKLIDSSVLREARTF
jgi:sulfonate transport system substrate-binding protein